MRADPIQARPRRHWQPTDYASVLIISVPRDGRQIAVIASELPGIAYLLQMVANSALAEIATAQFFHHLEQRTQICRCELSHLGEMAELLTPRELNRQSPTTPTTSPASVYHGQDIRTGSAASVTRTTT